MRVHVGKVASMVVLVLFGGGCGGGDATAEADVMKFLGTWTLSGQTTLTCAGSPGQSTETGTVAFTRGTSAPLHATTNTSHACGAELDAPGGVAKARAGASCGVSVGSDSLTWAFTTWMYTTADGSHGTYSQVGTQTESSPSGRNSVCTFSTMGTITKT
jgi:hypothetical protein